jgi:ribonuclease BN (tRNA processing enzyme)
MKTDKIALPLQLRSENELVLHFIGTGSAFTKKNYQNNLIIVKNDTHVVVDFGTKASQGLFDKGVKVADLKAFLITHIHADHIGSLEEVALIGRYFTKQKPDMIVPAVLRTMLWEEAMKGGIAYNEKPLLRMKDVFNVVSPKLLKKYPRPTYGLDYKGIDLKIFKTNHIPGNAATLEDAQWASGVIIDERILFTADSKFDRAMLDDFCGMFDIELIIHDCQLFTGGVHASYDELKTLPDKYKGRMLLTHYADNWQQFTPEKDGFLGFAQPDLYYRFPLKS